MSSSEQEDSKSLSIETDEEPNSQSFESSGSETDSEDLRDELEHMRSSGESESEDVSDIVSISSEEEEKPIKTKKQGRRSKSPSEGEPSAAPVSRKTSTKEKFTTKEKAAITKRGETQTKPKERKQEYVEPAVYATEYPGDTEENEILIAKITRQVDLLYPNDPHRNTLVRCTAYNLTFQSFYGYDVQKKVEKIINNLKVAKK
jgi:hypothetical protein